MTRLQSVCNMDKYCLQITILNFDKNLKEQKKKKKFINETSDVVCNHKKM